VSHRKRLRIGSPNSSLPCCASQLIQYQRGSLPCKEQVTYLRQSRTPSPCCPLQKYNSGYEGGKDTLSNDGLQCIGRYSKAKTGKETGMKSLNSREADADMAQRNGDRRSPRLTPAKAQLKRVAASQTSGYRAPNVGRTARISRCSDHLGGQPEVLLCDWCEILIAAAPVNMEHLDWL